MLIATLATVIILPATAFNANIINMVHVNDNAIACPAIMLAKRRIIKAKGFVNMLKNSINGIKGTGTLSHVGTSGQNISFQYSRVPVTLVIINVHKAKNNVIVILPVTFPPPGGKGITPNKLEIKIKKKQVRR